MVKAYVGYHRNNQIPMDINEIDSNGHSETLLMLSFVTSQKSHIEYLFQIGASMGLNTNLTRVADNSNNMTWMTCSDDITILIFYVKYHVDNQIQININEIDAVGQT